MDPISAELLAALAGGAGGEMGKQAWTSLNALVRRPFAHGDHGDHDYHDGTTQHEISSGETELAALAARPDDAACALALSAALASRSRVDEEFGAALHSWQDHSRRVEIGGTTISYAINESTFHGPVVMSQHISQLSFEASPKPRPGTPTGDDE